MVSNVLSPATDPDLTVGILAGGGAGSNTSIWFNSVSMTGDRGSATAPSFALAIGGTNPVVDVRDNILMDVQTAATGDPYAVGLDYTAPYSNLTSNFNDLLADATHLGIVGGLLNSPTGDRTTLPTWRSETAKDGNSISGDPHFVSAGDLHITSGSPVANIGI